uniref:Ig-like domain-containing protein n=1 Tax=Timema shepardi TaxID=629360 RepID=A0A7R9AKM1_TIMSH|nr:unnamed protein product [Timema shepardi]
MGVAEDFAPSFTQKPQLRQEDEGNRLIFECQLLASPKPSIDWFRGETQLSEDHRTNMKIQSIGTNKFLVVLELDDVIETDAGLYKVKAKNKMGEVAASINLNFSRGMEGSALELSVLDEGEETISPLTMQLAWLPPLLNAKPFFTPLLLLPSADEPREKNEFMDVHMITIYERGGDDVTMHVPTLDTNPHKSREGYRSLPPQGGVVAEFSKRTSPK